MQVFLEGAPWYKRWFWTLASKGLFPGIAAAIGFAYLGIPAELQAVIRRFLPYRMRETMTHWWPADRWLLVLVLLTTVFAIWGGLGLGATVHFTTEKYKRLLNRYTALKSDYDSKQIDCYKLFSNYLYSLSVKLQLGTNERISLYKRDLERYSCIGRFSDHGSYNVKAKRFYPANQGCIAKAWQVGSVTEGASPCPETDWAKYVEYHVKKYGFTEAELNELRMKSRSYFGVRLQNPQNEIVAVLMLESTSASGLPFSKINKVINDVERRHLVALIESLESHMPSLERANAEGF
jgi:hypothetical protein